jgi:aminoglycoside 3-N-acetyltransferase
MSMPRPVRRVPARPTGNDTPARDVITRERLAADLRILGVRPGQTLLVHASLKRIGWVEGAAQAVVGALTDVLGPDGTLVAGAGTPENSLTSRSFLEQTKGLSARLVSAYIEQMPAFDPLTTPTSSGAVAEALRTTPGAVRSDHPQSSFAAVGRDARELMAGHQVDCHLGEESPLARLYERNASILLLGVGYGSCTAFHLAEYRYTDRPPAQSYSCVVWSHAERQWLSYLDVVLDDRDFEAIGESLERETSVPAGHIGKAESRRLHLPTVVDYATDWFRAHRAGAR